MHIKANAAENANTHARAGERIAGNLYRGGGGQFQGGPGAQLQKRLVEIRAKRAGKGRRKAKGRAGAKPKGDTRTRQEKANQNRAAIAKEGGLADLEGPMVRLGTGTMTDFTLEKDAYDKLIGKGLAKRLPNGKVVLTPAAKKWRRAADKGDKDGAAAALAEGAEKAGKEQAVPKKKEGAPSDREPMFGKEGGDKPAGREKRDKSRQDRRQRAKERKAKADKAKADRERRDQEKAKADQDKRAAADTESRARSQADLERDQESARTKDERIAQRYQGAPAERPPPPTRRRRPIDRRPGPSRLERKAMDITEILEDLEAIKTELEEEAAAATKAGRRNATGDQARIDQCYEMAMEMCDILEALGADVGEEEGEGEMDMAEEGMEGKAGAGFAAMKEIGRGALGELGTMLAESSFGSEVKSLADGCIGAYAIRFGDESTPDMSPLRDYFTKSTDFWLDAWDRRPMLFHHAMDEDTSDAPRIGTWTKAEIKDEGVWLEGQLDKAHRYYGAIKELVRRGVLRLSSDSAPHLVRRATKAGNTHEVTRWPLLAASLTPTPAEPRLTAVSFKALLAELGLNDTSNDQEVQTPSGERPDGAKAADERARRLSVELQLIELETIA